MRRSQKSLSVSKLLFSSLGLQFLSLLLLVFTCFALCFKCLVQRNFENLNCAKSSFFMLTTRTKMKVFEKFISLVKICCKIKISAPTIKISPRMFSAHRKRSFRLFRFWFWTKMWRTCVWTAYTFNKNTHWRKIFLLLIYSLLFIDILPKNNICFKGKQQLNWTIISQQTAIIQLVLKII